jgi:DNA-binding MarR family transcriptional regulator
MYREYLSGWRGACGVANLKLEIAQQAPFHSVEEQALLNLIRTADCLERALQQRIRPWGITSTQYNVLRILRGAHPRGLTCSAIGERMLTAEPDVTRLVARLKKLHLARQQRDRQDRRVVWTQVSEQGLKLLAEMDPIIDKAPVELLGHLGTADLQTLIRLAEEARRHCGRAPGEPTCDGSDKAEALPQPTCDGRGAHSVNADRTEEGSGTHSGQPTCDGR